MAKRIIKKKKENEDILGIVAFGSLIENMYQITSKKSLESERETLKAYTAELKQLYFSMKIRAKQIYDENQALRRANEGLIDLNQKLLRQLAEIQDEIRKPKSDRSAPGPKIRRRYSSVSGERK
jgi:hypothetical protein